MCDGAWRGNDTEVFGRHEGLQTVLTSRCEMVCVMERGEAMTLKSSAGMRVFRLYLHRDVRWFV